MVVEGGSRLNADNAPNRVKVQCRSTPGDMVFIPYVLKSISGKGHNTAMEWEVLFQDEFNAEFHALERDLQDELLAHALLLREFGPNPGRPTVDSLKGSRHANMKELRFGWADEVWRVAFAFDPR